MVERLQTKVSHSSPLVWYDVYLASVLPTSAHDSVHCNQDRGTRLSDQRGVRSAARAVEPCDA